MARLRLYPHRMADARSVSWHEWWIERGGNRSALSPVLTGWDYASEETIGISFDLKEEAVLQSTGLASLEDLEILAVADCLMAQERFVARHSLSGYATGVTVDVPLQLPRGRIAGAVRLSAHLVLGRNSEPREDQVAYLRGARIHSSGIFVVQLEGTAGRFPTEAVAFSDLGYGNAPWSLTCAYDQLTDNFMGTVRLLINTEHPIGRLALEEFAPAWVGRMLRADLMRLLIAEAADQVEAMEQIPLDEGSLGQVLDNMCRFFFGSGLKAMVRLYRDEPAYFERLLHDQLDPLSGVIS